MIIICFCVVFVCTCTTMPPEKAYTYIGSSRQDSFVLLSCGSNVLISQGSSIKTSIETTNGKGTKSGKGNKAKKSALLRVVCSLSLFLFEMRSNFKHHFTRTKETEAARCCCPFDHKPRDIRTAREI